MAIRNEPNTAAAASSPQEVILKHLHRYQEQEEGSVTNRLKEIQEELEQWTLSNEMQHLSTTNDDEKDLSDNPIQETIIYCINCIMVAEEDASDELMQLLTALALLYSSAAATVQSILIQYSTHAQETCRAKACRFMGLWISNSSSTDDDDHAVETELQDAIVQRTQDKSQAVRKAAIQACGTSTTTGTVYPKLQQALLWSLEHDSSLTNRSQAVSVATESDPIIARLRDEKPKVRVQAMQRLQQLGSFETLEPDQCAKIVRYGLTDRCVETKDATLVLICTSWLKSSKYDPLIMLEHLQPARYPDECESILKALLEVPDIPSLVDSYLSLAEIGALQQGLHRLIAFDSQKSSTPEGLLWGRLLCQKRKQIATWVPDITVLCTQLVEHLQQLAEVQQEDNDDVDEEERLVFMVNQLFHIVRMADLLQEEGSRRFFFDTCQKLLQTMELPEDVLEQALQAMRLAHQDEQEYIETIAIIIQELQQQQDEDISETLVQLRIISILTLVLESTSPKVSISSDFQQHVLAAVTSDKALLRQAGISCCGRLALVSSQEDAIRHYQPLLYTVASQDKEDEIRAQAMLALSDLILVFGSPMLTAPSMPDDDEEETITSFPELLLDMLRHDNSHMIAVGVEVAARLLFCGRMRHVQVLATLLVVFFDKTLVADEDDEDVEVGSVYRMQQVLSLFFTAYAVKSRENAQSMIAAIGHMLTSVAVKQNKRGGGKASWPIAKMIEFVYGTAEEGTATATAPNSTDTPTEGTTQESSFAVLVCLEISNFLIQHNDNLTVTNLRTLCKLLGAADVNIESSADSKILMELKERVNELTMLITDASSVESLETIVELMDDFELPDETNVEEEASLVEGMANVLLVEKENENTSAQVVTPDGKNGEEIPEEEDGELAVRQQLVDVN